MSSLADPVAVYNRSAGKWRYYKLSIAGAVIMGALSLAGLVFLLGWYIRRARQARRLRDRGSRKSDLFGLSTVSLARTNKSIDAFLVKDADPVRTSLMFSRSPSLSVTVLLDDSEHRNPLTEVHRTSWNASASTLGNGPRSNSIQRSTSSTPRVLGSSAVSPTNQSSLLWSTTSADTETGCGSRLSRDSIYSHMNQSATDGPTSRDSQTCPVHYDASVASSLMSIDGPLQSAALMFNDAEHSRLSD